MLAIILLCIGAAIAYGIVHDQITARICLEYFTVGHPRLFESDSPTLHGLAWGILATWWVGLLLGIPLALAARLGRGPQRSAKSLVEPIAALLGAMAVCATLAGCAGYFVAEAGWVVVLEPVASRVPPEKHSLFVTCLWAHVASYAAGLVGGVVLIVRVWRSRRRTR